MRNHLQQEFGALQRTRWHWVFCKSVSRPMPEHSCDWGNLQTEVHIAKSTQECPLPLLFSAPSFQILPALGEGFKAVSWLGRGEISEDSRFCQDNCPHTECTVWTVSDSTKKASTGVTQVIVSQKSRTDEHRPSRALIFWEISCSGLWNILLVREGVNTGINPRIK